MYNLKLAKKSLVTIIQALLEKSSSTSPRAEMVVSPRKRFLREMEKDKQQLEDASQKRSRNKMPPVSASTSHGGSSSKASNSVNPVQANGVKEEGKSVRNSRYSINSLLGEDHNSHRSPDNSPSHFMPVTQAQFCSPPSDERWYSESVDRLRSIELSVCI